MKQNLLVTTIVAILMAGFVLAYTAISPPAQTGMGGMTSGDAADAPRFPPVTGYADGQEIFFIHTEASDPKIAKVLADMMQSPVLTVPSLARAPEEMLANVFVFANGIRGMGPLGFQPDVFDHPPGSDGYRPLRALNQISWKNEHEARELKSADDIQAAAATGEIAIERPGVVVNMPMLTWSGGRR